MRPHPNAPWRTAGALLTTLAILLPLDGCASAQESAPWRSPTPMHSPARTPAASPTPELVATADRLASGPLSVVLPQLAAEAMARGAVLELPQGRYQVTDTIVLPEGTTMRLEDGAQLTGDLPGRALVRLAAHTIFTGGSVSNASADPGFDVDLAQGAVGVSITGTTFGGTSANALYMAASGISDVVVSESRFAHVGYGVLLNPGALDARKITLRGNRFVDACADAIEINAATGGTAARVKDVQIIDNHVEGTCGSGDSAGFGIGLAGVEGFTVRGNVVSGARNEAIHMEDGSTDGTVAGNTIGGGGGSGRPAVAIYRTTSHIVVESNRITGFSGSGVSVQWDSLGSARSVTITDNIISEVSGSGVVVAGDAGSGPFTVTGNRLSSIGGDGISIAGSHALSVISGNTITRVSGQPIAQSLRGTGVTQLSGNTISP